MAKPREVTERMMALDSRSLRKMIRSKEMAIKPVKMADRKADVKMLRPK